MASYLILERGSNRHERAEKALIIRDGFSFLAFILPLFWFLWHRMWLEALAILAAALLLAGLATLPSFSTLAPLLSFFLYIFIGLEAQAFRVASLRRKGWEIWGVVEGANRDEAELRYAAEIGDAPMRSPVTEAPAISPSRSHSNPRPAPSAFGLVDYPRKG